MWSQKWGNLKNSIRYHSHWKHYGYLSYVESLNHDLRVPLKPGPGEYLLIRQTKCGRSSADDDRPTRIAGITFDLERVPVAFINSRHVSRIRGWCSCRGTRRRTTGGNKKGTRWRLQYVQSFFTRVYNGIRVKLFFFILLNRIIEQIYFSRNNPKKSVGCKFLFSHIDYFSTSAEYSTF